MLTAPPPADAPFQANHWSGPLPTAVGTIAKAFNAIPKEDQIHKCEQMTQFIMEQEDMETLNLDTTLTPFLIAVPGNTRNVRLVFGLGTGFGLNGIDANALQNNFLALAGEFETNISIPAALVLPSDTLTLQTFSIPTEKEFDEERLRMIGDTPNSKQYWYKHKDLQEEDDIPIAVPIPAFLALDGFTKDLDSVVIYERIKQLPADTLPAASQEMLLNFLKATLVKSTVTENNVKQSESTFYARPTTLSNKWKTLRLQKMFPTLFPATTTDAIATAAATAATPAGTAPQITVNAELIAAIIRATREALPQTRDNIDERKDDDAPQGGEDTLGLSESAFQKLLVMCGVAPGCPDEIPILWTKLAEKGATKADKESEVRRNLATVIRWKEAKVKPLSTIISMVAKRQFEGDLTVSTLSSATKGLTPFAVPCMTEEQVDNYNEYEQALASATSTTMTDVKANKLKATAPQSHANLIKVIKRFGNLIYTTFSEDSPLFIQIDGLVEDLENFEEVAQTNFTKQSIASTLWILHLQARHFAAGLMTGAHAILAEFQHMRNNIRMKLPVQHGDVPQELYIPPSAKKEKATDRFRSDNHSISDKDQKRARTSGNTEFVSRDEFYHHKIKAALDPIYSMLGHKPLIRMMCTKAGINQSQLFPNSDSKLCIKAQIQGRCFANCKLLHRKISDAEAEGALKALKKVIDKPELLKVN
jgi:hypothetical protein